MIKALSSVRLTVFAMALMMALIILGTLAQVHIGTFAAQQKYFNHWFLYFDLDGRRFPLFPGGLLVGSIWFVNLAANMLTRFKWNRRGTPLILIHFGLLTLLLGQFATQMLSRESQMAIELGQTQNYSESSRDTELVFVNVSEPDSDLVVSIPAAIFRREGRLNVSELPFTVIVKKYFLNAELAMGVSAGNLANRGMGPQITVTGRPPVSSDDETNAETAYIEILDGTESLGIWLVSSALGNVQTVTVKRVEYRLSLRPKRTYHPFQITLKDFKHDRYPGTTIPKNFSSLVRLVNPATKEDRETLIYMNHPLRYDGRTFYQSSFGKNDTLSVLQVVENPAWVTPYLACALVLAGLATQFLTGLSAYSKRRRA